MCISVHAKNISELFVNPKNIPKPGLRCTNATKKRKINPEEEYISSDDD